MIICLQALFDSTVNIYSLQSGVYIRRESKVPLYVTRKTQVLQIYRVCALSPCQSATTLNCGTCVTVQSLVKCCVCVYVVHVCVFGLSYITQLLMITKSSSIMKDWKWFEVGGKNHIKKLRILFSSPVVLMKHHTIDLVFAVEE